VRTGALINGTTITITTTDPEKRLVPNIDILRLQWIMRLLVALTKGAGPKDIVDKERGSGGPSSSKNSVLAQRWSFKVTHSRTFITTIIYDGDIFIVSDCSNRRQSTMYLSACAVSASVS
jgi:hypothetical protein